MRLCPAPLSEEKIVGILREAEKGEKPIADLCRECGIAEQTFYRWRHKYGELDTSDVQRLKELTSENARLKRLLAERDLEAVIEVLEEVFLERGQPEYLRSDNGPEFVAKAIQRWLKKQQVKTRYIEPGSPWQNAYGESFNGKFRDGCLNMEVFYRLAEARTIVETWRQSYNHERPHSSLGYQTPAECAGGWNLEYRPDAQRNYVP
ncbi:MAG: integrase core domain-containing protein [Nitrososphaerales archaeon]